MAEADITSGGKQVDDVAKKLQLLHHEGVDFDSRGLIVERKRIWNGPWKVV